MSKTFPSPGARLIKYWQLLRRLPGGAWLFSRLLGLMVPYTGTIGANVLELEPGHVKVTLRDRRKVRNHLRSVHAIALANLGEVASGLAVVTALKPGVRGIVVKLCIAYFKKARGQLIAQGATVLPEVNESIDHIVHADIHDETGEVVARATVTWRLSLAP